MSKVSAQLVLLLCSIHQLTRRHVFNLAHHEHTVLSEHFTEYAVLAVEEGCWCGGNEELQEPGSQLRRRAGGGWFETHLAAIGAGS